MTDSLLNVVTQFFCKPLSFDEMSSPVAILETCSKLYLQWTIWDATKIFSELIRAVQRAAQRRIRGQSCKMQANFAEWHVITGTCYVLSSSFILVKYVWKNSYIYLHKIG